MKSRTGCLTLSRLFIIGFSQPASLNQVFFNDLYKLKVVTLLHKVHLNVESLAIILM